MTPALPALPGEAPDPSATPRLDALLKEVEKIPRWEDVTGVPFVPLAPRLAAIVRVLREALSANLDSSNVVPSKVPGWRMVSAEVLSMARTALARAEAIAKGE